jgi:hypothetical protein
MKVPIIAVGLVAIMIAVRAQTYINPVPSGDVFGLQITTNLPPGQTVEAPADKPGAVNKEKDVVRCANLIYSGSKSSVCFSDKFLATVEKETNIIADRKFTPVKLVSKEMYEFPFAIMTGEGVFTLPEAERKNLRAYLQRGGFLLASAGCSSTEWNQSFRREIKQVLPQSELKKIPLTHPLFRTVFEINTIALAHGGATQLEGIEIDGRIVLIYSSEGLNDTGNVKGCCCCGGNEVKNCHEINVNVFSYALTH